MGGFETGERTVDDTYTNENDMVPCRLRVKGAFGVRGGIKQVCTMLDLSINITFGDELAFKCAECPDPKRRDELLEQLKDAPDCACCGKNMASETVTQDVVLVPGEPPVTAGSQLCRSCYNGVALLQESEEERAWQREYEQLERDYKDGKIPYSMLVDAKEQHEGGLPGKDAR